jgi:KaiC/GvpD/RAD55 family RecA-like ATPase
MTFQVRKAERQGARLLIQLSGVSGSGKTYSALQLAYGMTGGDASKIVLIDTENRRGSLYANALPQPFNIIDFYAPFSPARYIEAIEAACKAGAEVIVIDSVTHEWESEGGCEWIANQTRFPDWKRAKAEHKRFMTYMLQSQAHIIACTRAREKVDFSDPKNPRPLGIQPIQEKNFSFEATVSLLMHDQGKRQDVLKCPAELQAIMGRGQGYISAQDGKALRDWVDGAVKVDPAVEASRGKMLNTCERGLEAFKTAWNELAPAVRKQLGTAFRDQCAASATAYDAERAAATQAGAPDNSAFNSLNAAAAAAAQPEAQAQSTPAPADDGGVF